MRKKHEASISGTGEQARRSIRIGLALWGLAALTLGAGIYGFGLPAMFEPDSPDFIPFFDLLALVFVGFGTTHLGQGLVQAARNNKHGLSTLDANRAVLGQVYRGKVRTQRPLVVTGPYTIRLLCESQAYANVNDDSSSSKGRAIRWETSVSAPASTLSSVGIPFQFKIPADGLPNRRGGAVEQHAIYWTLSVSAPMNGLHYRAAFPIDVGASESEPDDDDDDNGDGVPPAERRKVEGAFAGFVRPESSAMRLLRFIAPIVGLVLLGAGAHNVADQWSYGRDGVQLSGRITAINPPALEVALEGGGAGHVARVTKNNTWRIDQSVRVTCLRDGGAKRSCRMDTGSDRWIDGVGTLAVGAALMLLGGWLWLRRRARSNA